MNIETVKKAICKRCGRRLKDTVSIDRQHGEQCWKKIQKQPKPLF